MDMAMALGAFVDESRELLTQMEDILLRADVGEVAEDDLNALFRCAHTIKGSGGLFGLDVVVEFTHVVENILDRLRRGELGFTPELVGLLLECKDHIGVLIDAVTGKADVPETSGLALRRRLGEQLGDGEGLGAVVEAGTRTEIAAPASDQEDARVLASGGGAFGADHWHLSLRFGPDVLRCGMDPLAFINYLRNYGEIIHVETVAKGLPGLLEGDPEQCYVGFEVALRSDASKIELESVFEFVRDQATITILPPHSRVADFIALIDSLDEDRRHLGEILIACGTLTHSELDAALAVQRAHGGELRLGEILIDKRIVRPTVVEAALGKQKSAEERRAVEKRSVKVPADRLDALIDQVGELVIAGASVQLQARSSGQNSELQEAASNLLRLVEDIRDTALRLRMTPIGEIFNRFPRVVRDISLELGKDIELVISGAETELDKSMVEKIGDPLMHMVRNAIDHGIESPDRREAEGKPPRGTVALNAYHESGSIVIEVVDDGGGLDSRRILAKAIERGCVAPDAILSEAEIYRLILEPGFSTAEQITNLSGRGVGMDVVKSSIEALRGTLDIESTLGKGSTMRLCLPLTLAIIDGFQVGVGGATFILPLDSVVECIKLPPEVCDSDYLNLRDQVLPFLRLRQVFELSGEQPARQNVVVVRFAGRQAGLAVDQLHGECQAVIKPLGRLFEGVTGISGSTILGSGEVALILDVAQLVQRCVVAESRQAKPARDRIPSTQP